MANTGFTGYTKSKFSTAKALPEGKYTYTVTTTLNGKAETESFPLTIDNQAPEVVKSEVVIQNGKRLWKVTVTDNHYVQAVCATLGSTPLTGWYAPNETVEGAESVVTFDLSDSAFDDLTQAKIGLVDYADNQTVSDYYDLTGGTAVGKNGFTSLTSDIRWNGNRGVLMLSYLQDGVRGGSLTKEALTDVARVTFATTAANGTSFGLKLTGVTVTGFDKNGSAVTLKSTIQTPSLTVTARTVSYDVNNDGKIDQLDITTCQRWYQAASGDADWDSAKLCDVNSDNKVDLQDMIDILQYLYLS